MADQSKPDGAAPERSPLGPDVDRAFLARLFEAPEGLREGLVCDWLIERVRRFLRVDPNERVEPGSSFLDLGFDSLLAVDFKLQLEHLLDCALRSTVVFDCPTPADLSRVLLGELALQAARPTLVPAPGPASRGGEPIAIVGMACRFPGGATDPESYWRLLLSGRDAITQIPGSRWDLDAWYDDDRSAPGKMYVRHGGFLDDVDRFDAAFFNITPREARELDPQQRLLLETAWEALERAGIAPDALRGAPVAYYLGTRGSDYFIRCSPYLREVIGTYNASGNALSTAAGRVSYVFGFTGPNFALDTACSSSLVALHQAIAALRAGEAPLALAAGVNLILDPVGTVSTCKANMLSPSGRCRAFSDQADGYVRSEGVGTLVLEPLSRALAAGRRPLALVLGSAINQDGASGGLTVPSGAAQAEVIRLALARAGVDPAAVAHVEAHGTGTALGDPIEVRALHDVYGAAPGRTRKLSIGSVKTNIGHCETAAGMAGVIAAVQALRHGELPAILHCARRSPHVDWAGVAVEPVLEWRAFERAAGPPRCIGVSSFGFSGTNAHVVLCEAPEPAPVVAGSTRPRAELVRISAQSETALAQSAARLRDHIVRHPELELADVAHTLAVGRADLRERVALRVETLADLANALGRPIESVRSTGAPRIAFLYAGQGAQRAGMGRELAAISPVFRAALARCSGALRPHLGFDVEELLYGSRTTQLSSTEYTQPALFAFEYALAEAWRAFGVEPAWVAGHSIGEYAAAVAAGVFTLEAAAELVVARGRLMRELAPEGAMLAVFAPQAAVAEHVARLDLPLDLAADNAPDLCTWSGAHAPIADLERALTAERVRCQRLEVSHAFHSRLLDPMLAPFTARVGAAAPRAPRIGFVSNLSGAPERDEFASASRWAEHARRPVRFRECAQHLLAQGIDLLIEIGPGAVLSGLVRRCEPNARQPLVPSLRPPEGEWASLLQAVGAVWMRGARIDATALHAGTARRFVELPTYPFQRERHWLDIPTAPVLPTTLARGPSLVGAERSSSLLAPGARLHETELSADRPDWLGGHRVHGRVIAPAALYACQAFEAAALLFGSHEIELAELSIERPLQLGEAPTAIETLIEPVVGGARWSIASRAAGTAEWQRHAAGRAMRAVEPADARVGALEAARAQCREPLDVEQHYAEFAAVGLEYSGPFRGLQAAWQGGGAVLAQLHVDDSAGPFPHPALLDLCLQSCRALLDERERRQTWLPVAIERLRWTGGAQRELCALARRVDAAEGIAITIELYDTAGRAVGLIERLQLRRADPRLLAGHARALAHELVWQPAALPRQDRTADGMWILCAAERASRERIAGALRARGGVVSVVDPGAETAGADIVGALEQAGARLRGLAYSAPEGGDASAALARLVRALSVVATRPWPVGARAWLVTRGAATPLPGVCEIDVAGAALGGAFASLAREFPAWSACHVDLDPLDPERADDLLAELCAGDEAPAAEARIAWRFGERHVARLRPLQSRDAPIPADGGTPALRCDGSGSIASLHLVSLARRAPGAGEVELEIDACGLNFKDVLYALGQLDEFARSKGIVDPLQWPLGMEACGRVTRVGAGVDDLRIGERVWCIGTGLAARHAVVLREQVARAPATLSAARAAGQPVAWSTVLWALERLVDLRAGETLFVNGAAGAIGHAAIGYARRVGARVIASADAGKHAYLRRLGADRTVDSRADGALAALARAGERVDVVLSGLGGALVEANLALLCTGGRYVELGKLGVWTHERVAALRPDVAYHVFDLELELARDKEWMRATLERLAREIDAGTLAPIQTAAIDVRDARGGFELLARRRAIGKLALALDRGERGPSPDRAYAVTGGRGGIGLAITERLLERGARFVKLLSRSAPDAELELRLASWRERGASIEYVRCDVASESELRAALSASAGWPELDTVYHAAGVLRDATLSAIRPADVAAQLEPKLEGLRQLRAVLPRDARIVSISSLAGVVGSAGQASYAAANAALDALTEIHARAGWADAVIAYGPWAEVGMAARLDERSRARLTALGLRPLRADVALDALEAQLASGRTRTVVADVDWAAWTRQSGRDALFDALGGARATVARPSESASGTRAAERGFARAVFGADPRGWLAGAIAAVTGLASAERIEGGRRFVEYGIDSLQSVELRNRIEHALDLSLPTTLLFDHPTLDELTPALVQRLTGPAEEDAALLARIERLSEAEARALLSADAADG